jgi:hypothetical protein
MCYENITEITKKLPCSKKDKILTYNIEGIVSKPEKKAVNLYEELRISANKY